MLNLYNYKWKQWSVVHYTFLKSETSARYSSDSGNGSNISVDLGGFLTQARHINRTIYTVTTMISKIVPAQAAPCRTKMQLACNKSYFDFYNFFLLWPCWSDRRKNAVQTLTHHEVWENILGIWGGGGNEAQIMHLSFFYLLKTSKILLESISPDYSRMHNSANMLGVRLKRITDLL